MFPEAVWTLGLEDKQSSGANQQLSEDEEWTTCASNLIERSATWLGCTRVRASERVCGRVGRVWFWDHKVYVPR